MLLSFSPSPFAFGGFLPKFVSCREEKEEVNQTIVTIVVAPLLPFSVQYPMQTTIPSCEVVNWPSWFLGPKDCAAVSKVHGCWASAARDIATYLVLPICLSV